MNRKFVIFLLITILTAQLAYASPAGELTQYNSLLKTIENSGHKQPLQGFFYIAKDLEEKSAPPKTRGFVTIGTKTMLNPHFLLGLAKKHGTGEDIQFFETYSRFTDAEWPDPSHPYMQLNTEGKLCVDTSSSYLYDFYAGWLKYLGGFPTEEYIGTLDIYQSYATEQLTMYEFHLLQFPPCNEETSEDDMERLIDKIGNGQDSTNIKFSKRIIRAAKTAR